MLLVHGIGATGPEEWDWNYVPALNHGFEVCTVHLPGRGLTDMQIWAEYVVYAVHHMRGYYHLKIDILGWSAGPLVARWAIKFWPDVQDSVNDMVGLEATYHGTADPIFGAQWVGIPGDHLTAHIALASRQTVRHQQQADQLITGCRLAAPQHAPSAKNIRRSSFSSPNGRQTVCSLALR